MKPAISVVDSILARHGLMLTLSPYKIVAKNGVVVQSGPSFDLRDSVLEARKTAALHAARVKACRTILPDSQMYMK